MSDTGPVPGDTPTSDELAEAERIARHHLRYQASVPLDMFVAEYDRSWTVPAEPDGETHG